MDKARMWTQVLEQSLVLIQYSLIKLLMSMCYIGTECWCSYSEEDQVAA